MTPRKPRAGVKRVENGSSVTATCDLCALKFTSSQKAASHARQNGHPVKVHMWTQFVWEPTGPRQPDIAPAAADGTDVPVELVAERVVDTALGLSAIYYRRKPVDA
ncbi:hypothetical protein IEE94_11415 [Yimella sp. cx-573]|nr:hypothetical protein [Yimella sp. cx-573]